jgi:hypothetical protein
MGRTQVENVWERSTIGNTWNEEEKEDTGEWRKLTLNRFTVCIIYQTYQIKKKGMQWATYVAHMRPRNAYKTLLGNLTRGGHFGDE